jgi:hypothetical protein
VRVLIPLPDRDFDVTEVAVPWRLLRAAGHQVVFATEQAGTVPAADPRLLDGVIFGQLGAALEAKDFYAESAARGPCPRAVPRPTTPLPSRWPTATTCRPAGPVTHICSAAASARF